MYALLKDISIRERGCPAYTAKEQRNRMKALVYLTVMYFTFLNVALANDIDEIALIDFRTKQTVNLSSLDKTKPTYIKLWATWCKPCMEQMPHFQKLQEEYGDKINVVAVNININETMDYIGNVISKNRLTMPVLLDKEGKLSEALGLVGTPYSVLINTDDKIVYTTHESNSVLDTFIAKLASGNKLSNEVDQLVTSEEKNAIIRPFLEGDHTLFFTATWCDWYLADSRPKMAKQCSEVQSKISQLKQKTGSNSFRGFVNHLWTDNKSLNDFVELYNIDFPVAVDTNGVLFTHFNIRSIPTIIKIVNGKVVERMTGEEIIKATPNS